jgi:hypothetical protein
MENVAYCTLDDAKLELATDATSDDDKLQRYIRTASRRVDGVLRNRVPLFAPYTETRRIIVTPHAIDSANGTLNLGTNFLLEASGVTSAGGIVLTPSTQWDYYPTPNATPYSQLRRVSCCGSWYDWCNSDCDPYRYISIAGVWGYHTDYATAWQTSDTLAAAVVSTSATEITLTNADGTDTYYSIPRLSVGSLIRIDTEIMDVIRINYNTNKATVRRGVLGTTAATHNNGTAVYAWQVEEPIRRGVARQAAFMNARRGRFDVTTGDGLGGTTRYPQDLLPELVSILNEYQYDRTY